MPNSTHVLRGLAPRIHVARSRVFDLDNGAGTTVDDVILRHSYPVTLRAARIVYVGATTGTVAAANVILGVAVAGATVVAETAYGNTKAVGTVTALTLLITALAADVPLIVRHTGVAATAAGEAYVEVEYSIDD